MTPETTLAYIAGALDADGAFGIKKSTWRIRNVGDCAVPTYSPRVVLGQVTPQAPELLKATFGGHIHLNKPGTRNSRPMYRYLASDAIAARIAEAVLPYLLIKPERAKCLLELYSWRSNTPARRVAWWFAREFPDWQHMPMMTATEVIAALKYSCPSSVSQAIANGTLLALPYTTRGREEAPRFPAELIRRIQVVARPRKHITAPQLVAKLDEIYLRMRAMNKLGVNGAYPNFQTPIPA